MRTMTPPRGILGVLLAAFAAATLAPVAARQARQAPPPPGTPKNFTLPAPTRFTLPNGLAVTMVPFGQVPKATVRLVVQAGSPGRTTRPFSSIHTPVGTFVNWNAELTACVVSINVV